MANIRISQLPVAPSAITGTELVPIVQNGQTVQTTVADITNSPVQTQTFLTVGAQSSLPNSRYIAGGLGIGTTDGGAQGPFSLFLNGTSASLENASTGLIAKTGSNTVTNRSIAVGTAGLSVSNGSGVSGDPTLSLTGLALSAATLSGNGIVSLVGGSYFQNVTLAGTTNQISIANPNGGSNPTFSIADNPVLPGLAAMTVPSGATGDRPAVASNGQIRYNTTTNQFEGYQNSAWQPIGTGSGTVTEVFNVPNQTSVINGTTTPTVGLANNPVLPGLSAVTVPKGATSDRTGSPASGMIRYNTDTNVFEGYNNIGWNQFALTGGVTSFSGGLTGLTPNTATTGAVTLGGTLSVAYGGTGANTLTGYVKGAGTSAFTANATIPTTDLSGTISNAQLANSSVTYNGVTVALGGSGTITASTTSTLTIGTGLSGGSFNGSSPVTIAIDSTVATLTGTQTLTNKTIDGNSNTLLNISNGSLTNSSITIGSTPVSLGGTITTLTGTSISGSTNTLSNIGNSSLSNSAVTINGSSVSLGGSITVTATATNALTIGTGLSGTSYNGSSPVTIAIDSTVLTESNTKTVTNKSISGATNTLTNIPNSSLDNSSITIGTTAISLGGSSLTLGGLTSVAVTQDPTTALQLATKQYVDTLYTSGIHYHQAVKYEVPDTTGNLNAIYNQPGGPGVGVGATLTNNGTLAAFAPDGPTASIGDRILIYNQTNAFENGVYTVTVVGNGSTAWVLTRATDADTYNPTSPNGLGKGDAFFVTSGNTGAGETYECNTVGPITFGTTAITFVQISSSQVYSAGTGLTLTGTTFSITNTGVSAATYGSASSVPAIAVNAQGQITSATNTPIAINANQVTSGTLATTVGGTGLSSFTSGGALYATSTSALTSGTLPITAGGTGITAFGTGVQTALGQNVTGSGSIVLSSSPTLITPALGTPSSVTLTNATGLPLTTGVTGVLPIANGGTGEATASAAFNALSPITTAGDLILGTGINTAGRLGIGAAGTVLTSNGTTASWSATYAGTVTSVSFTGGIISVANPTTTPALTVAGTSGGIPYFSSSSTWASSGALAANALVIGGGAGAAPSTTTTGTGVLTALGTNVGTAGAFVVNGGALGTPSSGTVTNLTGTASININGTVGATTPTTGSFTVLTASSDSSFTSTGALLISKGTSAQQPGSPATGMLRYNTTTNQFEGYSGSSPAWNPVGGASISNDTTTASNLYPIFAAATSGSATTVYTSNAKYLYKPSTGELQASVPVAGNGIFVNSLTISTSYTIAAGYSGSSTGPITIASGVSVTVASGSRWVVL